MGLNILQEFQTPNDALSLHFQREYIMQYKETTIIH